MPTYKLVIAYDGAGFHGYARQPGVRTVQGELETALAPHTGPVDSVVAGRTDKGVHAAGQVVSFTCSEAVDPARLARSLNSRLGPEVAVLDVSEVDAGFSARFDAIERSYEYRVLNREVPDPFLAATSWHVDAPLDLEAMNVAAGAFVGERDFASLCRKAAERATVREVRSATWRREGDLVVYAVTASSFCHQMVRSMVAICVDVGRGVVAAAAVPAILEARDRHAARGAAPAHGLTLVAVRYA